MVAADRHRETLALIDGWAASNRSYREVCEEVVRHLRAAYPHYNWVGIYMIEGDILRLWAWDGPAATEHVEIPLHAGVCGWAASTGQIANVPDVTRDERYLQCFLQTKSELVVPIRQGERVYGEIDIDSDTPAAFAEEDERFLSEVCARLGARAAADGLEGRRLAG
ncbi:MAG TPA: GAF domain-containing protein [Bacillota bacterium]